GARDPPALVPRPRAPGPPPPPPPPPPPRAPRRAPPSSPPRGRGGSPPPARCRPRRPRRRRRCRASPPQPESLGDCRRAAGAARQRLELLLHEDHPLQHLRLALLQVRDAELVLEIDLVVVLGEELALRLLPVLAHHDDGRLAGGDDGEDEVQEHEARGVVGHEDVQREPADDDAHEAEDERPRAAEGGDAVGDAVPEGQLLLVLL